MRNMSRGIPHKTAANSNLVSPSSLNQLSFIQDFRTLNPLCIAYVPLVAAISPSHPTQPASTLRLLVHRDVLAASTDTTLTQHLQLGLTAADIINLIRVPSQLPPWRIHLLKARSVGWPRGTTLRVLARAKHVFLSGSRLAQSSQTIFSLSISRLSTRPWRLSTGSTS